MFGNMVVKTSKIGNGYIQSYEYNGQNLTWIHSYSEVSSLTAVVAPVASGQQEK